MRQIELGVWKTISNYLKAICKSKERIVVSKMSMDMTEKAEQNNAIFFPLLLSDHSGGGGYYNTVKR